MRYAIALLLGTLAAAPAVQAETYRYVDEGGRVIWTDDLSRVPPAQRAEAEAAAKQRRTSADSPKVVIAPESRAAAAPDPAQTEAEEPLDEAFWRGEFERLRSQQALVETCRATLVDYCQREYVEGIDQYFAGELFVPEPCRQMAAGYPDKIEGLEAKEPPITCAARVAILEGAVRRVDAHWAREREDLERRARHAGVPPHWRR